ncbi:hypothetical protein Q5752_002895 [Cryptotrichosporon argae]
MADDLSLVSLDPLFHGSLTQVDAADFADASLDPALATPASASASAPPDDSASRAGTEGEGGDVDADGGAAPVALALGGRADAHDGFATVEAALGDENVRLRALIAALEARQAHGATAAAATSAMAQPQAHAHVSNDLAFELDGLAQHFDWTPAAAAPEGAIDPALAASTSGAASGLVFRLVLSGPSKAEPTDAVALTHDALAAELAAVQAGDAGAGADPATAATASQAELEAEEKMAGVLRDIVVRLEDDVGRLKREVDALRRELAVLVGADTPGQKDEHEAGVRRMLGEVRGFVETLLRQYRGKGTLPALPLAAPALTPLPSTLPKKRGRPSRLAPRASAIPPQLAHLVPDVDTVRAREADTPIRRKGVKRSRDELERERARDEEGDMLRSLVGIGGWRDDEAA